MWMGLRASISCARLIVEEVKGGGGVSGDRPRSRMTVGEAAVKIKSEGMEEEHAPLMARPSSSATRKKKATGKARPAPLANRAPDNFRGVRQRRWGKWVSEIRELNRGKRRWLGTFDNAVDAALAYDKAAVAIHGPHAVVNFPAAAAPAAPLARREPPCCSPAIAAAAAVLKEREVKPAVVLPLLGGSTEANAQAQQFEWDPTWAAQEMFEYQDDIAMYIAVDAADDLLPCYPGMKSQDCQVDDELDTDIFDSPLWD